MTVWGADVDDLERLAAEFARAADELDRNAGLLTRLLDNVSWLGDVATRFMGRWSDTQLPQIGLSTRFLREASSQLAANARQQREASASAGGQSVRPGSYGTRTELKVVRRESYAIDSDTSFSLFGMSGESTVVREEMSDGTYRVTVSGRATADVGIGVSKIVGIEQDLVDIGLKDGTGFGVSYVFAAADRESADTLLAQAQGKASHVTNRLGPPVDGTDIAALPVLADARVQPISITIEHPHASVVGEGSLMLDGVDAGLTRRNSTTYNLVDGTRTDSTTREGDLTQGGWNNEGTSYASTASITRDIASGRPIHAEVTVEEQQRFDTRGGGEKTRDAILGFVPGLDYANTEHDVKSTVTTYGYDLSTLSADDPMMQAINADDRMRMLNTVEVGRGVENADVSVETFEGEERSATRGLDIGSSTTSRGSEDAADSGW